MELAATQSGFSYNRYLQRTNTCSVFSFLFSLLFSFSYALWNKYSWIHLYFGTSCSIIWHKMAQNMAQNGTRAKKLGFVKIHYYGSLNSLYFASCCWWVNSIWKDYNKKKCESAKKFISIYFAASTFHILIIYMRLC